MIRRDKVVVSAKIMTHFSDIAFFSVTISQYVVNLFSHMYD